MANKGYFIITDISGYTEYLTRSELDHAHEILQSLFDAQIEHINFPLHISGFRGDAIFLYVPETDFISSQSLLETLENLYVVFLETRQQMQMNTTCTCRACKNMSLLDLKMCIHFGEYLIQKLADREELLGADVIVPHRMLKNDVIEKTNIRAYALFSESAASELNLSELCENLISHNETYEHIGNVKMQVHNLQTAWETAQTQKNIIVDSETAWIKIELDIPFPASLIWDYVTTPAIEAPILGLDSAKRIDELGGRTKPQSSFHCAHSSGDFFNKVVDWKPFKYYTVFQTGVAGLEYFRTIRFEPTKLGTRFMIHYSKPDTEAPNEVRDFLQMVARQGYERLAPTIQTDIENRKITAS